MPCLGCFISSMLIVDCRLDINRVAEENICSMWVFCLHSFRYVDTRLNMDSSGHSCVSCVLFLFSDYSIVMPATVWLGSNVEVQVAIGERTGGGEAICQLEFFHGISGPRFGFRRWQNEPKEVTYQNLHTMSFAGTLLAFFQCLH